MNDETKISAMLATILKVTPNQVTFQRYGEDRPRNNFRLATSKFPYDLLEEGRLYAIVSRFDGSYWSWIEAYELGKQFVEQPNGVVVVFKKPRRE